MKKFARYFCLGGLFLFTLSSCKTSQVAVPMKTVPVEAENTFDKAKFLENVESNAVTVPTITAKMKMTLNYGNQKISVGGNLKMKRDDVIQLALVGFGIVEGGRLEFTKDKVLILDRINNQYTYVPYSKVSFLKDTNLDFDVLQSLFWNEVFVPGKKVMNDDLDIQKNDDQLAVIKVKDSKELTYQFLTSIVSGLIQETNISDLDNKYTLHWKYGEFNKFAGKDFPTYMGVQVDGIKKRTSVDFRFYHMNYDSDWDTRTSIPKRYKEVAPEVLLKRLMSL